MKDRGARSSSSLRARIGALSLHASRDSREITAPADTDDHIGLVIRFTYRVCQRPGQLFETVPGDDFAGFVFFVVFMHDPQRGVCLFALMQLYFNETLR